MSKQKFKKRAFSVIAFIIPILLLCLIELGLRLLHYGHDTSLFIRYPDDASQLVMNKYASARFFSDSVNATKGYIEPFDAEKKAGTLRLVVLGESTAEGYPYFHNGSFHRWLAYRLNHTFPDKKIEVINLSLTAVNSYTVLDFSRQLAEIHPDAVLIYVGHNEYYGALGIGSTSNVGNNPYLIKVLLQLRKLRLVQLIENISGGITRKAKPETTDDRENLMQRMAARQSIPFESAAYQKGINQFRQNMSDVCKELASKHIPVLISTLVSNQKDLTPLKSGQIPNAYAEFKAGTLAYKKGDYAEAKKDFIAAKEYDLLRFRAPEEMDSIIRSLPVTYHNVTVVDTRKAFEDHSPHGIIGHETLLEHVHPNLYGYALMSEAFYQALKVNHIITPASASEMPFKQLLQQMPVTPVDSICGTYQIMMLKAGWPFNEPIPADFKRGNSPDEKIAGMLAVHKISWAFAMDQLFRRSMSDGNKAMALRATEAMLLDQPQVTRYYIFAAKLNFDLGNIQEAAYYFQRCYRIDDSFENARNLLLLYMKADMPDEAANWAAICEQKHPDNIQITTARQILEKIALAKKELVTDPHNANARQIVVSGYRQLGETTISNKYTQ